MINRSPSRSTEAGLHYVVWQSRPGGAESLIGHYVDAFGKSSKVHLYSLRDSPNEICDPARVRFQRGHNRQWPCYTEYFKYCRRHRDGLFHLINGGPVILLLTLLAGVRKPLYHIHGTIYWRRFWQKVTLKSAWLVASLFDVIYVANSQHSAAIFTRTVLRIHPRVIYNGFDVERYLAHRRMRSNLRRIGYAGRLVPAKNVDLLIRLFADVAETEADLELHIAGDGVLRADLELQARESQFGDRIYFHGWVQDVADFFSSLDLLVFLSEYESFGNVLAEALLTGLPVLTSDIPAFREIHSNEEIFVLGDVEDHASLRRRFQESLAGFQELSAKAYDVSDYVKEVFDIRQHLRRIESLYDDISSGTVLSHGGAEAVR